MARLFSIGWEMGGFADSSGGVDSIPEADELIHPDYPGAWEISTSAAVHRPGGRRSMMLRTWAGGSAFALKRLSDQVGEFWLRFGFKATGDVWSGSRHIASWRGDFGQIGAIHLDFDARALELWTQSPSTWTPTPQEIADNRLARTGAYTVSLDRWYLIELHWRTGPSADPQIIPLEEQGAYTIKVDGQVLEAAVSVDTQQSSLGDIVAVLFGGKPAVIDNRWYYDDCAADDADWCGDGRISLVRPDGAGSSEELDRTMPPIDFEDTTTADGTEDTFKVQNVDGYPLAAGDDFEVGDAIEYDYDGVLRELTDVNTGTNICAFTPPLSWATTPPGATTAPPPVTLDGKKIRNFGPMSVLTGNWSWVNRVPLQVPGSQDAFVHGVSPGLRDLYAIESIGDVGIPPNAVIQDVGLLVSGSTMSVGTDALKGVVKSGLNETLSASWPLPGEFVLHRFPFATNPAGGAWSPGDIEDLEIGIETSAV